MRTSDLIIIAIVAIVVVAILWTLQKRRTDRLALLSDEQDGLFQETEVEPPVVVLPYQVCATDVGTLSNGIYTTVAPTLGGPHHNAGDYVGVNYTWDDSVSRPDGGYILTYSAMGNGPGAEDPNGTTHVPGLRLIDEADYLAFPLGTNQILPFNTLDHIVSDNICTTPCTNGPDDVICHPGAEGYNTAITPVFAWQDATNVVANQVGDTFEVSWDPIADADEYAVSVTVDGEVLVYKFFPDDGQTTPASISYGQTVPSGTTNAVVQGATAGVAVSPGSDANVPAFQTISNIEARVVGYRSCNVAPVRDGCYGISIG